MLMLGDVFGRPGRMAVAGLLPRLRDELSIDFVVANGENAAGGLGITRETALPLFDAGVDVITLGNHTWAKKESIDYVEEEARLLRPLNFPSGTPGRGSGVFRTSSGMKIGVINLIGRIFMDPADCPFRAADETIKKLRAETRNILIDMHAEATSEKMAMGWSLDGRVSAVLGTHTHVQTSDERVLPKGTGYITDVGMVGSEDSVLGLDVDAVIARFRTRMPIKFKVAEGPAILCAVELNIDKESGVCQKIQRHRIGNVMHEFDTIYHTRLQSCQEDK